MFFFFAIGDGLVFPDASKAPPVLIGALLFLATYGAAALEPASNFLNSLITYCDQLQVVHRYLG